MWPEPLLADAESLDTHTIAVTTRHGGGVPVARVICAYNAEAGFGVFGEMQVLDKGGGPRQTVRALVLLVREGLAKAAWLGATRVSTEAPERLRPFASRMSGLDGTHVGGRRLYAGDLHAVRSVALAGSRDNGGFRDPLTPEEEEVIDAAIDHLMPEEEDAIDAAVDLRR